MHEPLFVGILLPLLNRHPWNLQRAPLLVGLEWQFHEVQAAGKSDGGDILRKLLRTPKRLAGMPESVAREVLQLPECGEVPSKEDGR